MDKTNKTENKQLLQKDKALDEDLFYDIDLVASATECTGLIPTPPLSEEEAESYTDIYAIPNPEKGKDKHLKTIEK